MGRNGEIRGDAGDMGSLGRYGEIYGEGHCDPIAQQEIWGDTQGDMWGDIWGDMGRYMRRHGEI
jgi:hypothetical protein